jgi:hypothetical protein
MLKNKRNDPLYHIYEVVADNYSPAHFMPDGYHMDEKRPRHLRLKITGFQILVPVAKDRPNLAGVDTYVEHFTKLCWMSELVGHTRPLPELDPGE